MYDRAKQPILHGSVFRCLRRYLKLTRVGECEGELDERGKTPNLYIGMLEVHRPFYLL